MLCVYKILTHHLWDLILTSSNWVPPPSSLSLLRRSCLQLDWVTFSNCMRELVMLTHSRSLAAETVEELNRFGSGFFRFSQVSLRHMRSWASLLSRSVLYCVIFSQISLNLTNKTGDIRNKRANVAMPMIECTAFKVEEKGGRDATSGFS